MDARVTRVGLLVGALTGAGWVTTAIADVTPTWVSRYDGPAHGNDEPTALAVDALGNAYVTGFSRGARSDDLLTVSYGADGVERWSARFDGPAGGVDRGLAVAADGARVWVAGTVTDTAGDRDVVVLAYQADTGQPLWSALYDHSSHDCSDGCRRSSEGVGGISVDAAGRLVLAGETTPEGGVAQVLVLSISPDGGILWAGTHGGPAEGPDHGDAVVAHADGTVYVAARSSGPRHYDILTLAYAPDGALRWSQRHDGPVGWWDAPAGLVLADGGDLFVLGTGFGAWRRTDLVLLRYHRDGSLVRATSYDDPAGRPVRAAGLALDEAGAIYVAATVRGERDWDLIVLKYAPDGAMAWQSRYGVGTGLDDRPVALAAAGGRVMVAGTVGIDQVSPCRRCPDMAVLEHDPGTGALDQVMLYDGPVEHMDVARGLALGRHGVTITGMSVGSLREWHGIGEPPRDYVTLRYPPADPKP